MTTIPPRRRQAREKALFGHRHYAYIAQFLSGMGTRRETIEHIACMLATDNPHFDREAFGRDAGLEHALDSYTLDDIKANLVTAVGIAERLGLRSNKRIADWRERYDDFPKPFLEGTRGRSATAARQAWYWWPDVEAFLKTHGLPKRRRGPRPPALTAGQIADAQRRRDVGKPVRQIAATLGVTTGPIYRLTSGASPTSASPSGAR